MNKQILNYILYLLVFLLFFRTGNASSLDSNFLPYYQYPKNPLIGNGSLGFQCSVLFDNGVYKMWYVDAYQTGNAGVYYAESSNGIEWDIHGIVLTPGSFGEWDGYSICSPTVIKNNGVYKMWYSGTNNDYNYVPMKIGYAESLDGIKWIKYFGNPVLNTGSTGEWDEQRVFASSVIVDNGVYKMWYSGWGGWDIGYAVSSDGIHWSKYSNNPVFTSESVGVRELREPSVIFENGLYEMWYNEQTWELNNRIGYAISQDGINWVRQGIALDIGQYGSWNYPNSYNPSVVLKDGVYNMWFNGYDGSKVRTGYANTSGIFPHDSTQVSNLYITSSDINFSNSNPSEGEVIIITGTVHNTGAKSVNCALSFYLDTLNPDDLINTTLDVIVPAQDSANVQCKWKAIKGNHYIHTFISNVYDSDLSDNSASKSISVDSSQPKLRVKVTTDKQKYEKGVDTSAIIIVKVNYQGKLISGCTLNGFLSIDRCGRCGEVLSFVDSGGIYLSNYKFTDASPIGEYSIDVSASKDGYLPGDNHDSKDKFFLVSPGGGNQIINTTVSNSKLNRGDNFQLSLSLSSTTDVSKVFADVRRIGETQPVFSIPLYDDGLHNDGMAMDGLYSTIINSNYMHGIYTVDFIVDCGYLIKKENSLSYTVEEINDNFLSSTVSDLSTAYNSLVVNLSNMKLSLNTITNINSINITSGEYSFVFNNSAKSSNISEIPIGINKSFVIDGGTNLSVAFTSGNIEIGYSDFDIPAEVNESDLRLYCWNDDSSSWKELQSSVVNTSDNIISASVNSVNGVYAIFVSPSSSVNRLSSISLPQSFSLSQNYPNPFCSLSAIKYTIGGNESIYDVNLSIYNIAGQLIKTLVNRTQSPGYYSVEWDGTDNQNNKMPGAVYFYRLEVKCKGNIVFNKTKRTILVK